jgi:hypothetical protein
MSDALVYGAAERLVAELSVQELAKLRDVVEARLASGVKAQTERRANELFDAATSILTAMTNDISSPDRRNMAGFILSFAESHKDGVVELWLQR